MHVDGFADSFSSPPSDHLLSWRHLVNRAVRNQGIADLDHRVVDRGDDPHGHVLARSKLVESDSTPREQSSTKMDQNVQCQVLTVEKSCMLGLPEDGSRNKSCPSPYRAATSRTHAACHGFPTILGQPPTVISGLPSQSMIRTELHEVC